MLLANDKVYHSHFRSLPHYRVSVNLFLRNPYKLNGIIWGKCWIIKSGLSCEQGWGYNYLWQLFKTATVKYK